MRRGITNANNMCCFCITKNTRVIVYIVIKVCLVLFKPDFFVFVLNGLQKGKSSVSLT